eukprot:1250301-Amphidinium_carterae.1
MAYLQQPVATTGEEVETLLALLDPAEGDADPAYSPIVTPEVQVVESSDSSDFESSTPEELAGLDAKETFLAM